MADREQAAESVSAVFARNARSLRTGAELKADQVARAVTARGLHWAPSRVSELEMGRIAPTLSTLLVLSAAFSDLRGEPVTLADWFAGDGQVALTDTAQAPLALIRAALNGAQINLPEPSISTTEVLLQDYLAQRVYPKPLSRGQLKKLSAIWDQCGGHPMRVNARHVGHDAVCQTGPNCRPRCERPEARPDCTRIARAASGRDQ